MRGGGREEAGSPRYPKATDQNLLASRWKLGEGSSNSWAVPDPAVTGVPPPFQPAPGCWVSFSCLPSPRAGLERERGPFEGAPGRVFQEEGEGTDWRTIRSLWLVVEQASC